MEEYEINRTLIDTCDYLIANRAEGIAWEEIFYIDGLRYRYSEVPTKAKLRAITILDSEDEKGKSRLVGLQHAIELNLHAKVHSDWVYRAFSTICEPDDNGVLISVPMLKNLRRLKQAGYFDNPALV